MENAITSRKSKKKKKKRGEDIRTNDSEFIECIDKCESVMDSVKSSTTVKFSSSSSSTAFSFLEKGTNLNKVRQDSDLLKGAVKSQDSRSIRDTCHMTSFKLADKFHDYVGELDVISDAENVKQLLKSSYAAEPVSLFVHRINKTILLDRFNCAKFVLGKNCCWDSLKDFILHTFPSVSKELHSFYAIWDDYKFHHEDFTRKFLHYSLAYDMKNERIKVVNKCNKNEKPPPLPKVKIPFSDEKEPFSRNVVWTFEGMRMLLGTNIPVFGNRQHPCVALKLRNELESESVAGAIDTWLDNLINGIPKVATCLHENGIISGYEIVKTEELPKLFSAKIVGNVAKHLFDFLKKNADHAGHTYWLLKGRGEDQLRLIDVTALCPQREFTEENPFRVPLALMMYSAAINAIFTKSPSYVTAYTLLQYCTFLLSPIEFPAITVSVHYLIANALVPLTIDPTNALATTNPCNKNMFLKEFTEGKSESTFNFSEAREDFVKTQKNQNSFNQASKGEILKKESIDALKTLEMRCQTAIKHITTGLACLDYFKEKEWQDRSQQKSKKKGSGNWNLNYRMDRMALENECVKCFENVLESGFSISKLTASAEKFRKKRKFENSKRTETLKELMHKSRCNVIESQRQLLEESYHQCWKQYLKSMLYDHASFTYVTLAILEVNKNNGDCMYEMSRRQYSSIIQTWAEQYEQIEEYDSNFIAEYTREPCWNDATYFDSIKLNTYEDLIKGTFAFYIRAMHLMHCENTYHNVLLKMGSIFNVMAAKLSDSTLRVSQDKDLKEDLKSVVADSERAVQWYYKGLECFTKILNVEKAAVIYANIGRCYRIRASIFNKRSAFLADCDSKCPIKFLDEAIQFYKISIKKVGMMTEEELVYIKENLCWDLSTTLFIKGNFLIGKSMEDRSEKLFTNVVCSDWHQAIVETMQDCLKYSDEAGLRCKGLCNYGRTAIVNARLAKLHENLYARINFPNDKSENVVDGFYELASESYATARMPFQFLMLQMHRVKYFATLLETCEKGSTREMHLLQKQLNIFLKAGGMVREKFQKEVKMREWYEEERCKCNDCRQDLAGPVYNKHNQFLVDNYYRKLESEKTADGLHSEGMLELFHMRTRIFQERPFHGDDKVWESDQEEINMDDDEAAYKKMLAEEEAVRDGKAPTANRDGSNDSGVGADIGNGRKEKNGNEEDLKSGDDCNGKERLRVTVQEEEIEQVDYSECPFDLTSMDWTFEGNLRFKRKKVTMNNLLYGKVKWEEDETGKVKWKLPLDHIAFDDEFTWDDENLFRPTFHADCMEKLLQSFQCNLRLLCQRTTLAKMANNTSVVVSKAALFKKMYAESLAEKPGGPTEVLLSVLRTWVDGHSC